MTDGICPFAFQVQGVKTFESNNALARVGFCDHTASGYYSTILDPNFWNSRNTSPHFAIARDGRIAQMINIFDTAWCQGTVLGPKLLWPHNQDLILETGTNNPNAWFISTEHEDEAIPDPVWPEEQYQADLKVKRWCIDEVKRVINKDLMRFGIDSLTGHFMWDQATRLHCPGWNWPQKRLYQDLVGVQPMKDGWVKEDNFWILYNNNIPVLKIGSTDGTAPGRISKLFGDQYLWLINNNTQAAWSATEGD